MSSDRHLIPLVERLDSALVACVGDLMLDHFIYGHVNRISPEAPIPVLHIDSQQSMLGGLGNVVRNLGALGSTVKVFSVTGEDDAGRQVDAMLRAVPGCQTQLFTEQGRKTPLKVRYIASSQQLLRADHETTQAVSQTSLEKTLDAFAAGIADCAVVVLSDYSKGMLAGEFAARFIEIAKAQGKPVIVDPKGHDFTRYRNATVIKPNAKELSEASQMPVANTDQQVAAARKLIESTNAEYILLTRGPDGMLLVTRPGQVHAFPSLAREVFDVSGAGDTVASTLAAAIGSGCSVEEAAAIANISAGIVVGKVGTAVVDREEIVHEIEHQSAFVASDKIVRLDQAIQRARMWTRNHLKVGFISGVFDCLTPADIEQLEKARAACDRLVIAVQSDIAADPDVEQNQRTRAYVLASMVFSDAVLFSTSSNSQELANVLNAERIF